MKRENHLFGVVKHVLLELNMVVKVVKATAAFLLWVFLKNSSTSQLEGGTIAIAWVGNGRRPHPRIWRRRLRFCLEAITSASQLTRQSRRKRNRRIPCHCLPSPKSGSTHTLRLLSAF